MALMIVILLRLGMRRQKLHCILQNRMIILLTMKAAWAMKARVTMIMMMMMMVTMAIITTITKYQDYNRYNSSVITERKDNHMLRIIYFYFFIIILQQNK